MTDAPAHTGGQQGGKDAVLQKRLGQEDERDVDPVPASVEAARSAAESSAKADEKSDEKVSLFWRVFGGTILSMVTLGAITLYNNISSNIAELRAELNRERDARAELVKKEEFNSRTSNQYERIRSFEGLKGEHEALKERVSNNAATVDALKKDVGATSDALKKDTAALEVLKERFAALEPVKKDVAGIELLKERLMTAAADLKTVREDVAKLQQEVERNKTGDVERKTLRDSQYKQVEESLKEVQKGLQTCREKLARLEGAQPVSPARGTFIPFEIPAKPPEKQ